MFITTMALPTLMNIIKITPYKLAREASPE